MKKITFLNMKGWYMLFLMAFVPYLSNGQCINSTAYLTFTSDNSGQIQQIGGCTYSTEYNTINGLIVGENYIFTAATEGVDKYVSITDASNVSIAHGPSPLIVNAITASTVRLHVSNSSACDGGSICHVTTVQFLADCPSPVSLGVTNLSSATATANWTAVGPGTEWDLEYGPTGFTQGTGTLVSDLVATTYNFIGLTPATTYQFYVRSECATEDSLWSPPFSFTTACLPVAAFSENFDAYPAGWGSALPVCWTKGGSINDVNLQTGSVAPASAPNYLYMWGYNGTTVSYASMPVVSNLTAGTHRLRFKAYEGFNTDRVLEVGYLTDGGDVSTYVWIAEVALGIGDENNQEFIVTPGILPATAVRLVFRNGGVPDGSTNAYIDDVNWEAIPTCLEPADLFVSEITSNSADFAWSAPSTAPANGYEYYLSTSSTNPTASTPATGSVAAGITELNLTLLTPATQYYIWVRSVCSSSDSGIWVGSASFKTLCVAVTEYTENFDSYTATWNGPIPDCWNKGGDSSVYLASWAESPFSAPNMLLLTADAFPAVPTESYASMPIVSNLQANTHRLRFKAYTSSGPDRFVEIGYLTDADDVSTYVTLTTADLPTSIGSAQQFIIIPGALPANAVRLAFKNTSIPGSYTEIYIDDVRWEAIPICVEPTGVATSGVLATSATITWVAPSSAPANGYEYYLSTSNTEPTASTPATGTTAAGVTTASLTPLTPSTQYYVWVRSVCSASETSYWTTSLTFTTPCASFVPNYTENFATFTWQGPPACWDKFSAGTVATGPTGPNNSGSWNEDGYLNVGFTGAAKINIYATAPTGTGWLVSPIFDLTAGGYQLKYDVGATQYANTGPISSGPTPTLGSDDFVYVLMSTDAGATWTALETYSATNTPSHLGATEVFNIPTVTSSTVKFAFYGTSGSVSEGQDLDFFIDNFVVQSIPVTPPACATNVTATIAAGCGNFATEIEWDAATGSDGYKLTIGTTAGGSDILNNQVVGGLSYDFIGSMNTTYYYTVVPFNVNGDATGCTEQSFTTAATGCYCPSVPTSNDGTGITSIVVGTTNFTNPDVTYTDNSASPVTLMQNVNSPVVINFATGYTYNTYIWIDSNDNYIFDTSELLYTGESAAPNPSTLNAAITIPTTTALGNHRMRVVTADGLPSPDSCYSGSYGVTIDFTVNVIEEDLSTGSFDSANFKYYPNPVTDLLTLSYSNAISEVVVYNLLGQQMLTAKPNATQTQMDLSGLNTGTYLVKITSDEVTKTVKVVKN